MKYNVFLLFFIIIIIFMGAIDVSALEVVHLNPTIRSGETENIELYVKVPDNTKKVTFSLSFFFTL